MIELAFKWALSDVTLRMYVRHSQSRRSRQLTGLEEVLEVARTDSRRDFRHDDRIAGTQCRAQGIAFPEFRVVPCGKHGAVGANHENCLLVSQLREAAGLTQI